MRKDEAVVALNECEDDLDEISSILEDDSLTPSEKCSAIEEIVSEDSDSDEE